MESIYTSYGVINESDLLQTGAILPGGETEMKKILVFAICANVALISLSGIGSANIEISCTLTPTAAISFTVENLTGQTTYDFGSAALNSTVTTTGGMFYANNTGDSPINIDIQVNNSNNWTYNTYANLGKDIFSANYSDDAFATPPTNILVAGSDLNDSQAPNDPYQFDMMIWLPTSTDVPLVQQTFKMWFTAEAAS